MSRFNLARLLLTKVMKPQPIAKKSRSLNFVSLEERTVPAAPVLNPIADQSLISNVSTIQIPVVANDADGDALTYSVKAAGSEAYFLATDLKLRVGNRAVNWGAEGEKWLRGGNDWYFIKPTGELFRWDLTNRKASGEKVGQLQPLFFQYTDLLTSPKNHDLARVVDDRLGLNATISPAENSRGLNEKWMAGRGGYRYFITPEGDFYRADGPVSNGKQTLLANFDPAYYTDLKLLTNAKLNPLKVSMTGNVLRIDNPTGVSGNFNVRVAVSDGTSTVQDNFILGVLNGNAPVIPEQPKMVLGVGESTLSQKLNATDADGDVLTYSLQIGGSEAYFVAREHNLSRSSSIADNKAGENEIWFTGKNGRYFLKPSGDLYQHTVTDTKVAEGTLIASLPPLYYYYPSLLVGGSAQNVAYTIDQLLKLSPTASPAPNSLNLNEKWFRAGGGTEFFITPEGAFYRRSNGNVTWLIDLSSDYYKQPARLYAATSDRFSANIDATGKLTVSTKPGFSGDFFVQVSVSDGVNTTSKLLTVTQSDYVSPAAPRVVGAISGGNKSVIVTFSQPMNNSAVNPANYQISQPGITSGVANLTILSAKFTGDDRTSVELTTLSQSEVVYSVSVVNVKDLGGTALAPKTMINGVVVDPTKAEFIGSAPTAADLADTDSDGLKDNEEQRGWEVRVKMFNGTTISRWVTSDPYDGDSDGDGLSDYQEANLRLDPRDADTDDDQLNDFQEFNELFSDSANQDTDGDTLDDSLEYNFFHSSPIFADTDGDQIPDGTEILLANRNVRIADVPKPGIEIGDVNLALDVRFTATSTKGTRTLESKTVSSTLTQTDNTTYSETDANSDEFTTTAGYQQEWSTKAGADGIGYKGTFNAEAGYTGQWTSSFTDESSSETQSQYTESTQTDVESTSEESVTREVVGATMKVGVSLKSLANLSFTIKNVQVVAYLQDPKVAGKLIPIATLVPDAGVPNEFTLGPLVPERGPFIFSNDQIFPSVVENLMLNPRGLIFKIANYDMVDERGRNFAFSSQDINDRTSPLVIDFGFGDDTAAGAGGTTERYRISTGFGRIAVDTNGDGAVTDEDRPVVFDPNTGKAVGVTISDVMQSVLGLTKYDEATTPSSSLTKLELMSSYSTKIVDGVEELWRIRDVSQDLSNPLKHWFVYTGKGIDVTTNFSDHILKTEEGLTFKFLQDLDNDGIDASQEFKLGSSDSKVNSDGDALSDSFEFFGRQPDPNNPNVDQIWNVEVVGKTSYRGYSSPARTDSDLDGIPDDLEFNHFVQMDTNNDGVMESVRRSLDAFKTDTDGDGVSDYDEINGYQVTLSFPEDGQFEVITVTTDPLNPDTDGDTFKDGDERRFGTDPTVDDADKVLDDDGDGLVNFIENGGWNITKTAPSTVEYVEGSVFTYGTHSSANDPDSDDDGLTDKEEYELGTDPRYADTDGDTIKDINELNIVVNADGSRSFTNKTNPLDADTDNDKLIDGTELSTPIVVKVAGKAPYNVYSDPLVADADQDGAVDSTEKLWGTDPTKYDTDGDNPSVSDAREKELTTDPLQKDQKVTIKVTSLKLTGTSISDGDSDALEIYGKVQIEKDGVTSTLISITSDNYISLGLGDSRAYNVSRSYVLKEGEKVTLRNVGFKDYDVGANIDDPFTDASVDLKYKLSSGSSSLSSDSPDNGDGIELLTNYTIKVEV